MDRHYDGVYEDGGYGLFVHGIPEQLLRILAETNTPDEERRTILEEFITNLQTKDSSIVAEEGRLLVDGIAEKHGLHVYAPEFEAYLRKGRSQRQTPTP